MTTDAIEAIIKGTKLEHPGSTTVPLAEAELAALRAEVEKIRRRTLLEASSEVADHWNDRHTMVNQYEQAQRSAGVLKEIAIAAPRGPTEEKQ